MLPVPTLISLSYMYLDETAVLCTSWFITVHTVLLVFPCIHVWCTLLYHPFHSFKVSQNIPKTVRETLWNCAVQTKVPGNVIYLYLIIYPTKILYIASIPYRTYTWVFIRKKRNRQWDCKCEKNVTITVLYMNMVWCRLKHPQIYYR